MNKTKTQWNHLVALCLASVLVISGVSLSVRAQSYTPADLLEQAWRNAQGAGSYRFISDINQTLLPLPVAEMIGQQETVINLEIDGAVVLPDQAYTEMRMLSGQRSNSVGILRDGEQSFLLQDGALKPVENPLNLASQGNDLLGYLASAEQVTLLDPPQGHPTLIRYSFIVSGPRYAEYVRQQTQTSMRTEPGAPEGLTLNASPILQQLSGQGELWVNQDGLPQRQVLDLKIQNINDQYSARIHMTVDLSGFGKIQTLPRAVQGPDGTWQLNGSLMAGSTSDLGDFLGFGDLPAQSAISQSASPIAADGWWSQIASLLPLRVDSTSLILFVVVLIAIIVVRYYLRSPRRCYALIVFTLIPIMVISPLLQSTGVVRFFERHAQAAEASAKALPDLLKGLGFSSQEIETASASEKQAAEKGSKVNASHLNPAGVNAYPGTGISARMPSNSAALPQTSGESLPVCGDGEPGVDKDSDGLLDQVELCLGTDPNQADSDSDGIPDNIEVTGFDLGGTHWDSDPLKPDSNGDGMLDTMEWSSSLAQNGQATSADVDGDGLPNLWDDDDDGDRVPDAQDTSPYALTGFTTVANLSTAGGVFTGYEFIEIQVQPEDLTHLRYSMTALDWPEDHKGNIKELDESIADLRLIPFLLVTTNVAPPQSLAKKYGFRTWLNDQGKVILMAPLVPVQENGAIHSYYTKVAYAPGQIAAIDWQAQMVWLAEMKNDSYQDYAVVTVSQTVHEYQDSFRITGLKVTKDKGYEAAVLGTPFKQDDLELFRVLLGMHDTFLQNGVLEGQNVAAGETALEEIGERFAPGSQADLIHTFNVPVEEVKVSGPVTYDHLDAGLIGVGGELVPGILQSYQGYYTNDRCQDADHNPVHCASLIIAIESSIGIQDLSDLPLNSSGTTDLTRLHVNLAEVPLVTTRGVQMHMYEEGSGGWQVISASRMLELMEQRYEGGYETAMRTLFPGLTVEAMRYITFVAYLWAISPSYKVIMIDGQYMVNMLANETALYNNRALPPEQEAEVKNAVNYFGLGTGLYKVWEMGGVGLMKGWDRFGRAFSADVKSKWGISWAVINLISNVASLIVNIFATICKNAQDLPVCQHEKALVAADIVFRSISLVVQIEAVCELAFKFWMNALKPITGLAKTAMAVGTIVGMAMSYATFVYTMVTVGTDNPITWRMALAEFIITEIYLIVLFIIFCIPIVGQIIAGILAIIDGLVYLFTWLFGDKAYTIATAILMVFYDAQVCTDINDTSFGEMSTSLSDNEMGLVGGNTLILSMPFEGSIKETKYGTTDDLEKSSISGHLSGEYPYYTQKELEAIFTSQVMSGEVSCEIVDSVKYCSNTAQLGFVLTPGINGIVPIRAEVDYTIIWASYGLYHAWRWSTNEWSGVLPEGSDIIQPEFMYLDILPAKLTDLWTWSELINHDQDGDGLTTEQEAALHTTATAWDSDLDGISDYAEWQSGSNPRLADSDRDGLKDGMERQLGTLVNVSDSDHDGLLDGQEVRRYENGAWVGGWQVTINNISYWVASDPMKSDSDGDGLTDAEEKLNGLSPNAPNQLVPSLSLSASPPRSVQGGRAGAYWMKNEPVEISIHLSNGSPYAVTSTLSLELPSFLANIQAGPVTGDRTPVLTTNGNTLSWSFSGSNALNTYEQVDILITAQTANTSGSAEIVLNLPFGEIMMRKTVRAVMDGDTPEVAILAPSAGAFLRGLSFVVGGEAVDPTTWVTDTALSIVPKGQAASFVLETGISSPWAYSWNLLSDGVYTLQMQATDVMGYTGTSTPIDVTVDNIKPTVTLTSQMVGGVVHLSGTAVDSLSGVAWLQLSLDGQPWRSVTLVGSTWSYDWTVGEKAQGKHVVSLRAIDRSGNQSDMFSAEILVDSAAPSSNVNAGADRQVPPAVKPNTSFNITGVADEGGHLPLPATPANLGMGMDVFDDSTLWLGISSIHENDGGVLAAWIGDFNADRLSDLAVGLPGPEGDTGQVAILYGRAGDWPVPPDLEMLATSPTRFIGSGGVRLGSFLAAAGDANGDNFSDLLIGERASSRAFLVFGNPGSLGNVNLDAGHTGYRTLLQAPANIESLAAAGDVNGDGFGDLLIRAGGIAYLVMGRMNPWPETIAVGSEAAATFGGVTGALGMGDVDSDQLDEWVTLKSGSVTLYGWNTSTAMAVAVSNKATADSNPQAVALGDVDQDGKADWLYSSGTDRILVYGGGGTHTFAGYDGFCAAPGDVDGDNRADILLTTTSGAASLVHQPQGGQLTEFAEIQGVGGAANAPFTGGADLNSDGSDDLLLIPDQSSTESRGFDAPDYSSGFISPRLLRVGTSTQPSDSTLMPRNTASQPLDALNLLSATSAETRYVDDDAIANTCDSHTPCYTTIQAAITATDGGGDTIIVYPGTYAGFTVPADAKNNRLTIQGISTDAVFIEGGAGDAIHVAADGVRLSNLTVRNAAKGVVLDSSAGEAPVGAGNETSIDHMLAHSVQNPISMNGLSALSLSDSTLVGDGASPIVSVTTSTGIYTWGNDTAVPAPIGSNGTLINAGSSLYALPGGTNSNSYPAVPATGGGVSSWGTPFSLQHPLPTDTGTPVEQNGKNLLIGGQDTISQLHSNFIWPNLGGLANHSINSLVIDPNNQDIYIGGRFTRIGTNEFFFLARWNGSTWSKIGTGLEPNGAVLALAFDSTGSNLYVGGEFTKVGTKDVGHVASWNLATKQWSVLGTEGWWVTNPTYLLNGVDGPVKALAFDTASNRVYIGGNFTKSIEAGDTLGINMQTHANLVVWNVGCIPSNTSRCYPITPKLDVNGGVRTLTLGSGRLYVGGSFTIVGNVSLPVAAKNIAYYNTSALIDSGAWSAIGAGLAAPVDEIAILSGGRLAVASGEVLEWNGTTWATQGGNTYGTMSVVADAQGNVYAGNSSGNFKIQPGGTGDFLQMAAYNYLAAGVASPVALKLVVDASGQLLIPTSGYSYTSSQYYGGLTRLAPASFYRHPAGSGSWTRLPYPPTPSMSDLPAAVVADNANNLYAIWGSTSTGVLYYYNSAANTWSQKTSPPSSLTLSHLAWAGSYLFAVGQAGDPSLWYLVRYDPTSNTWTSLARPFIPDGANAVGLSWVWDGADHIYMLRGDVTNDFSRYAISTNTWEVLVAPSVSFTISNGPALARIGSYLYVYGTGSTNNTFHFGSLPASDLRLKVNRTAFVVPDTASSIKWTNLEMAAGSSFFRTDIDTSNAWVGRSAVSASPALPAGATRLTSEQAAFMAAQDGLYRLDANSSLTAGYHHYKSLAHVYVSRDACAGCDSGSQTWGVDAFATLRQAVESGAARVLVHPGRYPQTFYLVSGVEVIGSGAMSTIIEPPGTGAAATLVTAEGVAHASLAQVTLAGGALWDGFLAEGKAKGLKLTRTILRGLKTGLLLRGDSQVEIVNNTIVSNTNGIVSEGTTPLNVRNTILAYNSGTGITHATTTTSLSNTYNDFWSNGANMNPASDVSLGSLFVDPRFRSLADDDLRLAGNSPLIDMGSPSDSTLPGGGQRVDIGYAEFNSAGFYVSHEYSETGLNDGLVWGVDAFDSIQPALNAAAAAMRNLQGDLIADVFSVAVDTGTYTGNLIVPSHVRLVGSGAAVTTISPQTSDSTVAFDGVIDSELSGFTIQNTSASGAGVDIKGASSGITLKRNVITLNQGDGIRLAGSSSAEVFFNTIVGNAGTGVHATGTSTWVTVRNNILEGNATGLQAGDGALVRNGYNLLHNTNNLSGVTLGEGTLTSAPAFAASSYYVPSADSPAIDAADPLAEVPLAGGLRADMGYKELIASPLVLVFGPEIASTVTGNSGIARVEVAVVRVSDATIPVTDTLPTSWETLTPGQSGQPYFYWSHSESQSDSGLYRVYSRATDGAGNTEAKEIDWYEGAFVIDNIVPTVSWGTPLPGSTDAAAVLAVVNTSGTVTTGTGTRDDVAQVYFSASGPLGTVIYPAEAGKAWIPLPVTGSYSISAVALDEAGNQASQSAVVAVSTSLSVATISYYAANIGESSTKVILRGYVRFTSAGTGTVAVKVNGGTPVPATLDKPGQMFSTWSVTVTLPAGTSIQDITVTPSLNGTTGLVTVLDKVAPTLTVTSPAATDQVLQTVGFAGTASDVGSGLAQVEVSLDGGYTWTSAVISGDHWNLNWTPQPGQDYVSYPAQVRAVDAAGNMTLVECPVTIDNAAPTGLEPVTFNQPVGQHLEKGDTLMINWTTPVDASGSAVVLLVVDMNANTVPINPTNLVTGTSSTAVLNTMGDWYVHLMSHDAAGNQFLTHFGPWHVADSTTDVFGNRRKSVIIDGFIDLAHKEWKANDLIGEDARSGYLQELYAAWDGNYVFLGWSGAWWTLNGVLWAYLDTVESFGTNATVDGSALPEGLSADRAIEINSPNEGSLWTWDGGAWVESSLDSHDFANGSRGDTEVRVLWDPSPSQKLNLFAFALPRAAEQVQPVQAQGLTRGIKAPVPVAPLTVQDIAPWAVFPTTNALDQTATQGFEWTNVSGVSNTSLNQPMARTIQMVVSSPQASEAAWGSGNELEYVIALTNPEPTAISNLEISLTASEGITYQTWTGGTCPGCTAGSRNWKFSIAVLGAGETTTIHVYGRLASILSNLQSVMSTFSLIAGTTAFTPESRTIAAVSHRVDGQAPTVAISSLSGSAIPTGAVTFTGTASDGAADGGPGSGVAYVEVSLNGVTWMMATGKQAWSITLPVTSSPITLQARAKDYAGIKGNAASHTFYVDSAPPTVTWTLPAVMTANPVQISGSVQDQGPAGSLVRSVEIQIDETGTWYTASLLAPQNGTQGWVWSWIMAQDDGLSRKVRIRAKDEAGNVTITASQVTMVDCVAPKISITQQVSLIILPSAVTLLGGTIKEGSALTFFHVTVYGPNGFFSDVQINPVNGNWTYAPSLTGWSAGTYKLRMEAKDKYGNYRLIGPFVLVVKDSTITVLTANNDSPHPANKAVTFTASIASGSNVTYSWTFGDGGSGTGQTATHTYTTGGIFAAVVTAKNSANTMSAATTVTIDSPIQTGPVFTVNNTASINDHQCDETHCTLREAIEAANNDGLDSTIELSKLDYGLSEADNTDSDTINLLPKITTKMTINGHGARIYRAGTVPFARFFSVPSGVHLTLNEVWLQAGKVNRTLLKSGGAISNFGTLIVKNSLLENNEADAGGAIYNGGTLYLINSTLVNNTSDHGAISGDGSFYLYSNTFLNNNGTTTSAIHLTSVSWSVWGFYNNLVATSSATAPLCSLGALNIPKASNLATDTSCTGFGVTTYASLSFTNGLPTNNGGPTPSISISTTSSAVDKGFTSACKLPELGGRDQRGYNRFADGNGDNVSICDVGAFEFNSTQLPPAPAPDVTPPQVRIVLTPASPNGANGWYRSPVVVYPQAQDTQSAVIDLRCVLDPKDTPGSFDDLPEEICPFLGGVPVSMDGLHSFYMAAMDLYSNKSGVISVSFRIDATPPVITCPIGGTFLLKSGDHRIGPAGVDALISGLDEAASTLSGSISTASIGNTRLTFTAADLAGNSLSQECGYRVIYDFGGFYPPVTPAPALNTTKPGSAIPLMFSLAGDQGLDVIAPRSPMSQQVDCLTLEPIGDPLLSSMPGKNGLSYDPKTGLYNVIWKTEKSWAGTCRVHILQLIDGTKHIAYFNFK